MIVADTNLVSYLLIEGERTEATRRVWQKDPEWRLPPLWRSEFLNVLATLIRAELLDSEEALAAWFGATRLFRGKEREPAGQSVLAAAVRYDLSAYDAHFVVVAEDLHATLVTGDREILAACPALACSIEDFA